ncbi:MAG TPA: cytochrome c oxidase subunit 3 [Erythrobacter sp.]|jgi:cytochrome c oxidase subunit 3|uniref:Cytochrome c oxidase subunit 3 n=1 Tax=Qipengyuania citrea TaxID=225971 RepID=A0A6I4UF42_9SPHN|nr:MULTISPECIES: cytochrome c oxidase subunit 3 [Erythrobacteraceae]MAC31685.1 cytochrome c oxidase subunit 3 [Erythrobacter sp.]MBB12470.1 cytochrome c oxidase subunit 3 [Sphingomonadaceae bacterium]MBN90547.1 cytochrome c oxidase subunit 3 [Erythrobacteraceae bacterium]MCZ4266098.1 cytochrome c oxidase subunit 3 [Erythrobacter sp. G21629-S1]KZX86251.1 cytochrome B562 [Erythrobacter sp. HI0019]|tara:strand:- start:1575 stop:2396 length:822 start_codon:yes stop_codon:yes gene_type:complete
MAGNVNHEYHILEPDIWPFVGSFSALTFTSGMVLYMHEMASAHLVLGLGIAGLIATFFAWFGNIVKEAERGDHTPIVQLHMRYGMILFIASEVMFFVGWFWSWFDFALFPSELSDVVGGTFPPAAIEYVIDPFSLPLLNTLILLCSGTTVTWAHHSLIHGDRDGLKKGLWLTIILGAVFTAIQAYEYAAAPFEFGGNTYSSAFYMATGFHGFHVLVGTIFLIVCLVRTYKGHFTPRQHFGFEAAAWYWHFVDVVWLFLFITVYVWGGWGAAVH